MNGLQYTVVPAVLLSYSLTLLLYYSLTLLLSYSLTLLLSHSLTLLQVSLASASLASGVSRFHASHVLVFESIGDDVSSHLQRP